MFILQDVINTINPVVITMLKSDSMEQDIVHMINKIISYYTVNVICRFWSKRRTYIVLVIHVQTEVAHLLL